MAIETIVVPLAKSANDLGGLNIADLTAPNPASTDQLVGLLRFLGVTFNYTAYFKFDIAVRAGSTLSSVRFDWNVFGTRRQVSGEYEMGWLSPDGLWDSTDGFANSNYPTNASLPAPERQSGTALDPTVWHDDAPAWAGNMLHYIGDFDRHSYGDGTLGQEQTMTGLVAQLQSYLDDPAVEALRVGGPTGTIPVCLAYHAPWAAGNNTPTRRPRQGVLHFDGAGGNPARIPTLTVEYNDNAVIGRLKAKVTASTAADASATMTEAVDGQTHTRALVDAKVDLRGL